MSDILSILCHYSLFFNHKLFVQTPDTRFDYLSDGVWSDEGALVRIVRRGFAFMQLCVFRGVKYTGFLFNNRGLLMYHLCTIVKMTDVIYFLKQAQRRVLKNHLKPNTN